MGLDQIGIWGGEDWDSLSEGRCRSRNESGDFGRQYKIMCGIWSVIVLTLNPGL